MTPVDAIVIGGGLVGCSAALHLRKMGQSVTLIERRTCGSQASGVNYGGVRQQGRHSAELPIARRSRRIWDNLGTLIGETCEFEPTGHLKLARNEAEIDDLSAFANAAKNHDLRVELVDRKTLRKRYPWLGSNIAGGSFCAEDGHANPRLVAPAFARTAASLGATIKEHAEVVSARFDGANFEVALADGNILLSRHLINTTGAWGSAISDWFDEPVPEDVMAPNMCVTEPLPYFMRPNLGICGGDVYVRQIRRGNVIFGAGVGVADRDAIHARPLSRVTVQAAALAIELVPSLRHAYLIRSWSGIEGVMPDGLPVIGESVTTPGLFHAFGFSGHGFQMAPAVGAILAELCVDGDTPIPIEPFRIDRFQDTSLMAPATAGHSSMASRTSAGIASQQEARKS